MKTLVNYRHKAAQMLDLYRWLYNFYKNHTVVDCGVYNRIYRKYERIRTLYELGLISDSCANRAFKMCAAINDKYYRGVNNGGIK